MKNVVKTMMVVALFALNSSCTKDDDASDTESNCYECSTETESLDVCITEDGDFLVDGERVANPNNASLDTYIRAIEANPNDDPALEGITCERN